MPRKWIPLVVLGVLTFAVIASMARIPNPAPTTLDGAVLALGHMEEWAKWMSGIQTAALGALGLLILKDAQKAAELRSTFEVTCAIMTFVALGAGLFCSAWVLSSLPSMAIRLHSFPFEEDARCVQYDIYEQPLYGWLREKSPVQVSCEAKVTQSDSSRVAFSSSNLGYMLTLQHYLWGIGLLSLAGSAYGVLRHDGTREAAHLPERVQPLTQETAHNPADRADG